MVWLNEQTLDFTPLVEVKKANSGKGYILVGKDFDAFIWNNDKVLSQILAAIAVWIDSGIGKQLEIHRDKTEKRGFVLKQALVKNKPVTIAWRFTDQGYTCKELTEEDDKNPFL